MIKFPISQAGQLLGKLALGLQAMHRISNFMSRENAQRVIREDDHPNDNETVLSVFNGEFFVGTSNVDTSSDGVQMSPAVRKNNLLNALKC